MLQRLYTYYYRFWIILPKPDADNSQCLLELQIKEKSQEIKTFWEVFLVRLKLIPGLLQFMIPLTLVYLFEYFINQGLVSIISYNLLKNYKYGHILNLFIHL